MFFTYLWQSSGLPYNDALDMFSSVLAKQCDVYKEAFGQEPRVRIKQLQNILIGQIQYEYGITGWEPWIDKGKAGIVWGGVCENYLGKKIDAEEVDGIMDILNHRQKEMVAWDGMFSVVAWDEKRVSLTTSATACPTLWYTEGPYGWASGPRAAPLLELTGRRATPNRGAMELYLLYGYFIGGRSPFKHVRRICDRQQIILEQNTKPRCSTYVSLGEYLEPREKAGNWNESVSFGAERIMQRVHNQLSHSMNPVVLLTGGRDSRSIAAAAKKTGYRFTTATSGPADSEDIMIASRISKLLGVEHRLSGDHASPDLLYRSRERLRLWTQLSEGLVPLSFCLPLRDFLAEKLPFPQERTQVFHGHESNIGRCLFYPDAGVDKLTAMSLHDAHESMVNKNRLLKLDTHVNDLLQETFSEFDALFFETHGRAYEWLELVHWKERGLTWGMDVQSIYSPVRWAWMPLLDRELMLVCRNLSVEQKMSGHFLVAVSSAIEPALAEVTCTGAYALLENESLVERIKRRLSVELRHRTRRIMPALFHKSRGRSNQSLEAFWELLFMGKTKHIWREFIDKGNLKKIIKVSPQNALLWRLVTVEFLAELFFDEGAVIHE